MNFPMEHARNHADECYPMEAAGLFIEVGCKGGKIEFMPCGMSHYTNAFMISPHKWLEAETRGRIVGVFHSHVNEPPILSGWDYASLEAWGLPWVIMSVPSMDWAQFEPRNGKMQRPLLGRRFTYNEADCYSLIKDYYSKIGVGLPDYQRSKGWEGRGENLYLENYANAGFDLVQGDEPQPHDVLLMQIASKVPNHGAIYIGDDRILHHLEGQLSARAVWGDFYKKATTHILRYKDLCH